MSAPFSSRALAAAFETLKQEKEKRLKKLDEEETARINEKQDQMQRDLDALAREKELLATRKKRESAELDRLRAAIQNQVREQWHEEHSGNMHNRISDFRGTEGTALRERLLKEGFAEAGVLDAMRHRTLDQAIHNPGGLQARFGHDEKRNPLEAIMSRDAKLYDMTDRRVLERLGTIREEAREKGYLSGEEKQFVENVAYLSGRFEENPAYREKDDRQYLSQARDLADGIRRDLGLDNSTSTLTYGRNT